MTEGPAFETSRVRALALDFDGVILESTEIKEAAFRRLFADFHEHLPAIVRHHRDNLGISRFDKFRWIYENLLDRPLAATELDELGRRFSELVFDEDQEGKWARSIQKMGIDPSFLSMDAGHA